MSNISELQISNPHWIHDEPAWDITLTNGEVHKDVTVKDINIVLEKLATRGIISHYERFVYVVHQLHIEYYNLYYTQWYKKVNMTLSATFPNERKIMDAIAEYRAQTRPEIIQLIEESKPLPPSTEILNRFSGKWERISSTALEAANRRGLYSMDPCAWHYSWRDIWPRMRIES